MQYECVKYYNGHGDGYSYGYVDGYGYDCSYGDGYGYGYGDGFDYDYRPAILVTGVKLEEVVLNALLLE